VLAPSRSAEVICINRNCRLYCQTGGAAIAPVENQRSPEPNVLPVPIACCGLPKSTLTRLGRWGCKRTKVLVHREVGQTGAKPHELSPSTGMTARPLPEPPQPMGSATAASVELTEAEKGLRRIYELLHEQVRPSAASGLGGGDWRDLRVAVAPQASSLDPVKRKAAPSARQSSETKDVSESPRVIATALPILVVLRCIGGAVEAENAYALLPLCLLHKGSKASRGDSRASVVAAKRPLDASSSAGATQERKRPSVTAKPTTKETPVSPTGGGKWFVT
jgi:hypothetical protein